MNVNNEEEKQIKDMHRQADLTYANAKNKCTKRVKDDDYFLNVRNAKYVINAVIGKIGNFMYVDDFAYKHTWQRRASVVSRKNFKKFSALKNKCYTYTRIKLTLGVKISKAPCVNGFPSFR